MALSYVQYTGDGVTVQRSIPFPYISRAHIEVKVDNVVTAFTWVTDSTISISPAPAAGAAIDIRRNTPDDARLVDFQDAASATAADLDLSADQQFYLQQELIDREEDAIRLDTDTKYNALSRVIKNVADGVDTNDAVNRGQLSAAQLGALTPTAASIENVPAGDIAGTTVQAALNELDTEKASRAGNNTLSGTNTVTGTLIVPAADAATEAAQLQQVPNKNGIVNGALLVWQDGTSFTGVAANAYIADNLKYDKVGTVVQDAARVSDTTSAAYPGLVFNRARLTLTTAQAAMAAGDFAHLTTFIEGYQWQRYKGSSFTLQFLVKLPVAGTYCVSVRNSAADYSYVAEFTYATANTDQLVTITVPTPPAGSWLFDSGIGARVCICLASGTTYGSGAVGWQAANKIATANQTNSLNVAVGSTYEFALLRVDPGPVALKWTAADFDPALVVVECERYYEKSYPLEVVPGTVNTDGCENKVSINVVDFYDYGNVRFRVRKRATPTTTIYSVSTGASGKVRDISAGADRDAGTGSPGQSGLRIGGTGMVANNAHQFHWVASSRF